MFLPVVVKGVMAQNQLNVVKDRKARPSSSNDANNCLVIEEGAPIWLRKLLSSLKNDNSIVQDAFVTALYIIMYECGFSETNGPKNKSGSFNIDVMKKIKPKLDDFKDKTKYKIDFYYKDPINECALVVVPTTEAFIVNLIKFGLNGLKSASLAFSTIHVSVDNEAKIEHGSQLAFRFKQMIYLIKCEFSHTFINLPIDLHIAICRYLDVSSFSKFTRTCKSFQPLLDEEYIWKSMARKCLPVRNIRANYWKGFVKYQLESTRNIPRDAVVEDRDFGATQMIFSEYHRLAE